MLRAALLGCVALAAGLSLGARTSQAQGVTSRVTWYEESGYTASGVWTYEGEAACGGAFPMGSTLLIVEAGVTVVCADTGYIGYTQVDVFSPYGRPAWMSADFYHVVVIN